MARHVNRDEVESRLQRLDEEYGIDYREEETVSVDAERFDDEIELSREGYIGSSYALVIRQPGQSSDLSESMPDRMDREEEHALMIMGPGGKHWGIPGGGREGKETFEESARREVREETDVECTITDCFGVRYEQRTSPEHDEILYNLRVLFTGEYAGGSISIQPDELNGAAWFARRPTQVYPLVAPLADDWFEEGG